MNKQEYTDYQESVARFFEREGISCMSAYSESWFSWTPCDCCGSHLGGDRYGARGYHLESGEVLEYEICIDCVCYVEYGELDDETMLTMERIENA